MDLKCVGGNIEGRRFLQGLTKLAKAPYPRTFSVKCSSLMFKILNSEQEPLWHTVFIELSSVNAHTSTTVLLTGALLLQGKKKSIVHTWSQANACQQKLPPPPPVTYITNMMRWSWKYTTLHGQWWRAGLTFCVTLHCYQLCYLYFKEEQFWKLRKSRFSLN